MHSIVSKKLRIFSKKKSKKIFKKKNLKKNFFFKVFRAPLGPLGLRPLRARDPQGKGPFRVRAL